ncbi:MAG: type I DNA topoisomerase [Candidatus Omnitrophota bacterium]
MSKYLVIVESPTKARTISSILGEDYEVVSSMGHLVDLPVKRVSIDVHNNYKPDYRVIPGKEKIVSQLKSKSKDKKIIYLATDPDREGEAISWHIKEQLSKKNRKFLRVVFHEITEDALLEAFKKPSDLDMDKVNAQIARRVLDRLVGYSLSPVLWKKIVRGLSAGRVQSIALKFIVEREKEYQEFEPKTTFGADAVFKADDYTFKALFSKYKGRKAIFEKKETVLNYIEKIKEQTFRVKDITKKQISRKPSSPYITSLLQQDAFNKLRFSAQRTMSVAQRLYEGIQTGGKSIGLITYMRTDSFHISAKAKKEAKDFIQENYGQNYLALKENRYKKKKGAQLAHEAIRPTSFYRSPEDVACHLSEDELKLYELIWKKSVAVFMKDAVYENSKAIISSEEAEFETSGRRVIFDGFLKVLGSQQEEQSLPPLKKEQEVILEDMEVTEHTTKPPPRYNDASLVKLLEEKGIGRPSTYAPTIFTLIKRNYAKREKRYFVPTDLGIKVNNLLVKSFPKIMDENFTAFMEDELDEVEKGVVEWHKILEDFYPEFNKKVEEALAAVQKEIEYSDKICPQCQARMVLKWSRKGRFLSCEDFPKCRYAESITTGISCPECSEGQLIARRNKRGQDFYGCSKYPKCTYTSRTLPEEE